MPEGGDARGAALLLGAGLLCQGGAALLLGRPASLPLHGAGALLSAFGLWRALPPPRTRAGLCLLALLCLLVPLLGPLGLLVCLRALLQSPAPRRPVLRRRSVAPPPPGRLGDLGDRLALLWEAPVPRTSMAAVFSVQHDHSAAGTRLLRAALSDPNEDVRLLAHGLLGRREGALQRRLHELEQSLLSAPAEARGGLRRALLSSYEELLYQDLIRGEARAGVLRAMRRHAEVLLAEREDAQVLLLLGRALLRQGHGAEAEEVLLRAETAGLAPVRVRPYLAEAAFQQRCFLRVRAHLHAVPAVPRALAPQRAFWGGRLA